MKLNLEKQTYFDIQRISSIKKYDYELDDIVVNDMYINSKLNINICYYDQSGVEKIKQADIPIEILKDEDMHNIELKIDKLRFDIIEGNGVSCHYDIEISFDKEEAIPIPTIIETKQLEEFDEIDVKDNVITTKTKKDTNDFLNFFKTRKAEYYKLKYIQINSEEELKDLSQKYEVELDDLYKGYDPKTGYVIFHDKKHN